MQNFHFNLNSLENLSTPIQQIMDLNQKTLRKFSFMEPGELTQFNDPKMLLEKNIQIFIDNGHASLDYMHQLFHIMEHSWINLSNDTREKTKDMMKQTQSIAKSVINKASHTKTSTSLTKHASSSSRKKTSSSSADKLKHNSSKDESPKTN
ncbi:hypothetical protein [Legionella cincinnatiensis]|uniref:Phasin protein n=1 Tax=Legionella cincinnatiensis TaxID=28085 RepID=A0A378IJD2_9GAMM|nr:hypothetical protein [Legionella cincinnatiensis]KTC78773.1 hypothetical protein Lcin_3388 [Legionella cincinnatiensis]STX35367.1 Uncharacterised protein [Legionella cincinnatiensis]